MNLKDVHLAILAECYRRQQALPKKAPKKAYWGSYDERLRQARADYTIARQLEHGPAWSSVAWFGAADAASQKRYSRALCDREAAGLILVTVVSAQRAGWVRLTPEGERLTREIAATSGGSSRQVGKATAATRSYGKLSPPSSK